MKVYISKKLSKSWATPIFLFVLLLMLVIEFPVVDLPIIKYAVKDAEAVIGRPASPGSVAGVRRRTRRRVRRRHIALGTRVYALPAGCTSVTRGGVLYHHCSGAYYRPYYEGNKVVYVVENP